MLSIVSCPFFRGFSIFDNLHFNISLHLCLTTQSLGIIHHTHIFLAVVSRTQVLHPFFHVAHARGAEAVATAGVFHGNPGIQRYLENGVSFFCFHFLYLAVLEESDFGHGSKAEYQKIEQSESGSLAPAG